MTTKKRTSWTRRLVAVGLFAGLLTASAAAVALDKNDILTLQASGLAPDVIVQVIRSTPDAITITPAEVEELRIAGVAQPVLDEICMRVGCTPGGTGPGPVGPGGGGLEEEIRRQQELEAERMRLEQERMERERQQMLERIQQEQAAQADVQQAFAGLTNAERAFRAGRYIDSAAQCDTFMRENPLDPASTEYYTALTCFVRAMDAAGYRHVTRARALESVLYGPTSEHFEEMFGILSAIATEVGYLDPQFETLTGYTIGGFDQEFQDEFNFFLGRFFWIYGEYNRAVEYFARVSDNSELKAKGHYLSAVMLLEQNENSRAYGQLQNAVLASERGAGDADVGELAYLALARIAYEVGQFDAALYYYFKVDDDSYRHPRAMFEIAWTYFMKQDFDRAVGTLHSLHSPYYAQWYWSELYVIEAASYLQVCNLDSADDALAAFYDVTRPIQEEVQAFIGNMASPQEYWAAITTYYDREGTGDPVALPVEAIRYVLSDVEFVNQIELLEQLYDEQARLQDHGAQLGTFAQTALAGLTADIQTREIESGLKVSAMIRDFESELVDWTVKAQEVGIEVRTERIGVTRSTLSGETQGAVGGSTAFVLAADWQFWPWEGEYWLDEVDNYRANLQVLRTDAGQCFLPSALEGEGDEI